MAQAEQRHEQSESRNTTHRKRMRKWVAKQLLLPQLSFRWECERCRLTRGAVAQRHKTLKIKYWICRRGTLPKKMIKYHFQRGEVYAVKMKIEYVGVAESVYAHVWGACGETRAGSSPAVDTIKQTMTFCYRLFYCSYGNDANIGFQDICDGSFVVSMPNYRAIGADL